MDLEPFVAGDAAGLGTRPGRWPRPSWTARPDVPRLSRSAPQRPASLSSARGSPTAAATGVRGTTRGAGRSCAVADVDRGSRPGGHAGARLAPAC